MSSFFLDTSSVVKRYVAESGSAWIRSLTDPVAGNHCWVAAVTRVELLAAVYRRVRTGTLTPVQAGQIEAVFRHELSTHFQVIPLGTVILDRAMELVAVHPLRAYDALQLAAALYFQSQSVALGLPPPTLLSADHALNLAASSEGMSVDDPNLHPRRVTEPSTRRVESCAAPRDGLVLPQSERKLAFAGFISAGSTTPASWRRRGHAAGGWRRGRGRSPCRRVP
jgi:predicted nucleic acid-binding protein